MSVTEKLDVLDLIITTLKEHEKALDLLTERLELVVQGFEDKAEQETMRRFYR
jgi:hypothetical protein